MSSSPSHHRTGSYIAALLVIAIGIGFIAYLVNRDNQLYKGDTRNLTFTITASGGYADITLSDSVGQLSFSGVTSTPWEKNGVYKSGDQVYLTAGNPAQMGSLSCAIKINGLPWKSATSELPEDKVGCAGIIP